ncbi:MAG: amino acid adenylation domain-containing protein [Opitutus sp.]|nr:amino acid adenylation domain-containing protein [Opitutus sp.]MCS6273236.1 amino acid adenylation domain-containing protein [Opitutus sp.]MCS6298905.1 amino acid adenylation domain-containing protein [Opitutus sp.]
MSGKLVAPNGLGGGEATGGAETRRPECLHQWFEAQVELKPKEVAVVFDKERITYQELNRRANHVAQRLIAAGVGHETLVGVFMDRSVHMIVAMLGVLKAGGAYVPLDPVYPPERLAFMLADTQAGVILAQTSLLDRLESIRAGAKLAPQVYCVDSTDAAGAVDDLNPDPGVGAANLAYVIYTSGSTGKPKGVAVEHRNSVALVAWASQVYSAQELDGVLAGISISFDPSILDIFMPLCLGGKVILAANTLALPQLDAAEEVRLLFSVPSVVRELLRMGGIPSSVETINMGGEHLSAALVQDLYALPHLKRVYDLYGPTETTTCATYALRTPEAPATIGRPINGTQVYVLDSQLRPVPAGETGELFIGGHGVVRGYLNNPDINEQRFIPSPFSGDRSSRLYRTGDRGRFRPDGNLEFIGRDDRQVKIRGFRVELGEVETALRTHNEISEALVVTHDDKTGKRGLVAYVVPHAKAGQSRRESQVATRPQLGSRLRAHLKERLPDHMVPGAFMVMDRFALTPAGKIDHAALPPPEHLRPGVGEVVGPRDATEALLCQIWGELLKLKSIGVHEDFFQIGGDSLMGAVMFTEVEKRTGVRLPIEAILRNATVERMAVYIEAARQLRQQRTGSPWVEIQPLGERRRLFLVHGVGGGMMWGYANLARHLGPNQPIYAFRASPVSPLTINEMAAQYVRDLRAFQPEGPYLLGGYCFGGNIAYEMSRMLMDQGQRVDLLVLFNTSPPNCSYDCTTITPLFVCRFFLNLTHWFIGFVKWGHVKQLRFLRWKFQMMRRRVGKLFGHGPSATGFDVETQVDLSTVPIEDHSLWTAHVRANGLHQASVYQGKVTLLRTLGHPFDCNYDPLCGWADYAKGGITVKVLPGLHESLLEEPQVRLAAKELKTLLDQINAEANPLS